MIVGKSSGFERVPELEMSQLDLRSQADIAGEQTQHRRFRKRLQRADGFPDPRADRAVRFPQNMIQPKDVALEKSLEVFLRGGNVVDGEKLAHQAQIGSSGEF